MAGLDVVVAHDDGIIVQIGRDAGIDVRHVGSHIVEVVGGVVALQVVAHIDQDGLHAAGTQFLQIRRNIGQRSLGSQIVHIRRIEISAVYVGRGTDRDRVFAVGQRLLRREKGNQAAYAEAHAEQGDEDGCDIQYTFFHWVRYLVVSVNISKESESLLTGKRSR